MSTITKATCGSIVLIVLGGLLTLIGLPVSALILFSGVWGLAHGFPILIFTIPMCVFGIRAMDRGYRRIKSGREIQTGATHI